MDYETLYKKKLEDAKYWHDCLEGDIPAVLEEIFPELKESEDERIRKKLIEAVKGDMVVGGTKDKQRAISWLERQRDNISGKCNDTALQKQLKIWFEKGRCSGIDDVIFHPQKYGLEKQGEQKPIDKVEPKFKVGNWIIDVQDGEILHINKVLERAYEVTNLKGGSYEVSRCSIETCNKLWTIQDAKDGDVLQLGNVTAIFKELIGDGNCRCYCSVCKGEFEIPTDDGFDNSYVCYNTTPATKEQRDLLFDKMKEEGYEWDAEKKELKKIEIITHLFNVGDTIVKKRNSDINDFGRFTITNITGGKYWYNDRIICDIKEQDRWEIYESVRQNPAWSEEDEENAY